MDVAITGNYALVADLGGGLSVIDISSPASLLHVGSVRTIGWATAVECLGKYAYVACQGDGLQIIDIGNPALPVIVGAYDTLGTALGVAVSGNTAFLADGEAGLDVIDISNPASPARRGGCDTSGKAYDVAIAGQYVVIADWDAGVQIINVCNLAAPVRVGGCDTGGKARGIAIAGNYVYVADWDAGLQIIRVTLSKPEFVATNLVLCLSESDPRHRTFSVTTQYPAGTSLDWHLGDSLVHSGAEFTPPLVSGTFIYTVVATSSGLGSSEAATVTLTVVETPKPFVVDPVRIIGRCLVGSDLSRFVVTNPPTRGQLRWYDGEVEVGVGATFIVPVEGAGTYAYEVRAISEEGCFAEATAVVLRVVDNGVIFGDLKATGAQGRPFEYQIEVCGGGGPFGNIDFYASGLPEGLSLDQKTGAISGIPLVAGEFDVELRSYYHTFDIREHRWDTNILGLTLVSGAPKITGSLAASGKQGMPFFYAITATNNPTGFLESGLTHGLWLNPTNGVVTGTPQVSGGFNVQITATNRWGSDTRTLSLILTSGVPSITSALAASGKQGVAFTYAIAASNEPTGFAQSGLPLGLSLDTTSGVISGIPKVSGSFAVSITASNPWGSDTKMLALALASGVPSITSALTASGKQGATFTYAIAASNEPTGFAQSGLPLGLSLNTTSGVISGIPQISGSFAVSLTASNPWGSDTKILALALASGVPSITSALAASGQQGVAFTYAIAASNEPTGFAQTSLPAGLSLNGTSGVISGIPQISGNFAVSLTVSNPWGSDTKILTLVLTSGVPVITGSLTANGKQGIAFSYAVRADHNPTGFAAADLPSGLEIDGTTGVISGRPLAGGTFSSTITATNNYGADTRALVITVASSVPVITSVTTVSGQEGQSFSYTIQATESPTEFGADGLPAGLSVTAGTGAISGKPMYGGKQEVVIWARNAWGTGSNTLVLNLAYAAIGGLSIGDVTNYYSSPYLVDFEFSLRDNDDPMVGHAVVRSSSELKVVCREDGRSISPTETAFVVEPRNRKQLKSYLVLDYTASMQFGAPDTDGDGVSDAIENMEAAAKTFISQQPAESQYGVYEFHREDRAPVRISRFTSDKTALRAAIDGILAKEIKSWFAGSRCWDALAAAVKEFGPPNRDEQRYVVFLSDGRDESSTNATPAQIVTAARERGVKLYCVAFGSEIDTATLQLLTGETRGRYYVASGAGDLSAQFAQVGKDLDGQYLLRWATLKQGSAPFRPSFEVTVDGKTAAFNTNLALPSRVPDYVPTENAGDRLAGALRLVADADEKPRSVTLRAAYVPRYIRNLRVHYRANYPCTTRLRSAATGEILNGWNLKESEDGQGGKWLELTSPSPADLKTSIRYGAMGNLVRFDFTELRSAQDAFSVFEVDNAIYLETGGQSFALENAGQFITVMQPTPHGTPPNWLAAHAFTGDLAAAEMSDPDRDGLLTWQEYRAGTDPRDQASSLVIRPAGQGGAPFHVAFSSVAGKHYRVEATVDFGGWQVVQGGLVGTGESMVVTDTRPLAGARQVYYRLVVE